MLWKNSNLLGVKNIDDQHKALFDYADSIISFMNTFLVGEYVKEYNKMFHDIKNLIQKHFIDEEKYQKAIEYSGYAEHKAVHDEFLRTLTVMEKKMVENNFSRTVMEEFLGILLTWLANHVEQYDKAIISERPPRTPHDVRERSIAKKELERLIHESCQEAVSSTFKQMFKVRVSGFKKREDSIPLRGDIFCTCSLYPSDLQHYKVCCGYTDAFALKLFKLMTGLEYDSMTPMVSSAMAELTDIISSRITASLNRSHSPCVIHPVEMQSGKHKKIDVEPYDERIYLECVTSAGHYDILILH